MHILLIDLDDDDYDALKYQAEKGSIGVAEFAKNILIGHAQSLMDLWGRLESDAGGR